MQVTSVMTCKALLAT